MRTRGMLLLLLVPALTVGLSAGCERKGEQDDVAVLKLAHGLDVTHPVHKGMVFMAERVKEKSGGKLRIDIYPNEQLGTERECIEQVQLGALAMTKTSTGAMEGFVPQMRVFGLPYLFRDDEHMWKVFNGPLGKELLAAGVPKGLKGLCYYDAGARSFYTRDKKLETPEDLAGMKIRVMQSEMCMKMVSAMGGSPTPIAWGELYTSLQQGVVDGAENNPPSFHTSKHYEICKYYILDEHLRLPDMLLISPKVWEGLSPEHQKVLQQAVDESVVEQRKLWAAAVAEALEVVQQAGVTIIRPDKKPFREAVQAVWAEVEGTEVGELAKRIQAVE
ncbi:MAG TPA: TRAP transporter substrate-binding protein [Phycisphaerae bacterium]|nr:TRAP transporter substrate-binding protein [Phycisphaerae bacterium]